MGGSGMGRVMARGGSGMGSGGRVMARGRPWSHGLFTRLFMVPLIYYGS